MSPWLFVVIGGSEIFALYLIWKLWCSNDYLFFKIGLTFIALIPILGPILAYWLGSFPSSLPLGLRDWAPNSGDFLARWGHVLSEKNPDKRKAMWEEAARKEPGNGSQSISQNKEEGKSTRKSKRAKRGQILQNNIVILC